MQQDTGKVVFLEKVDSFVLLQTKTILHMLLNDIIFYISCVGVAFFVGRGIFILIKKAFFGGDIVLTNPRTGKSIVLGKHHVDGQAKRLLEVLEGWK